MYPAAQLVLDHATEILLLVLILTGWLDSRNRQKQDTLCKCERCMKKRHHN